MTKQIFNEDMSAMIDGELSEFETHKLIREISESTELQKLWAEQHALRAVLRDEWQPGLQDFTQAVMSQLDDTASASTDTMSPHRQGAPSKKQDNRLFNRLMAGVGVAASVAVVSLMLFTGQQPQSGAELQVVEAPQVQSPEVRSVLVAEPALKYSEKQPAAMNEQQARMLNAMIVSYNNYAASMGGYGFSRLAAHDGQVSTGQIDP